MEVTNRFKRLDLIDRVPEELWMEVRWHCTGGGDQEKEKGKMVVLQIAEKRYHTSMTQIMEPGGQVVLFSFLHT